MFDIVNIKIMSVTLEEGRPVELTGAAGCWSRARTNVINPPNWFFDLSDLNMRLIVVTQWLRWMSQQASKQKRESAGHRRYAAGIDILSATSHNKKGSAIAQQLRFKMV